MMTYDRIVCSTPVNKTAARVFGRGVHWEPAKKLLQKWDVESDTPLPIAKVPVVPSMPNLTGNRRDRLVVIGYGGTKGSHAVWVCRCDCGVYCHRRTKFLTSAQSAERAKCSRCDYLSEIKAGNVPEQRKAPISLPALLSKAT